MNLLEILRSRVDDLSEGAHSPGLKAVLQHIDVAVKHLTRGQDSGDETAFTDAIYRTNQAFEGSLKEAYRVLAGRNPSNRTLQHIEDYLQAEGVLRSRVLDQFTSYRRNWRNSSTHDYWIDFDEAEALLAIVTVSAFSIVLLDQISVRVAYELAKISPSTVAATPASMSLVERVALLAEAFAIEFGKNHNSKSTIRKAEAIGTLAGFLNSVDPHFDIQLEPKLAPDTSLRPDLLLGPPAERLIFEVKIARRFTEGRRLGLGGIEQISHYMKVGGMSQSILLILTLGVEEAERREISVEAGRIIVIGSPADGGPLPRPQRPR